MQESEAEKIKEQNTKSSNTIKNRLRGEGEREKVLVSVNQTIKERSLFGFNCTSRITALLLLI